MTKVRSRLYRLVERRLVESSKAQTLAEYIAARRPDTSWRDLAAELVTDTQVELSHESLRLWFPETDNAPVGAS